MKLLSRILDEGTHQRTLMGIFLGAFLLRLAVVLRTMDVPGDGPWRAIGAYNWARSPSFQSYGVWLPGHSYLAGVFSLLLTDPLYSSRVLNVILGACTIPLIYALIRRVFDSLTALVSALLLACFPLHIGLSASSFTEISFTFEILAGMLFLIMASEPESSGRRALYMALSLFSLCLAVMTRYEAWVLIPVYPLYHYWRTRKKLEAALMMTVLAMFPCIWTINNYIYLGDPFKGLTLAKGWYHGAMPVTMIDAIGIIDKMSLFHVGWIVFILVISGMSFQTVQAIRRKVDPGRMLYLAITAITLAGVVKFAMARGTALYDRYLLFAFMLVFPLAVLPCTIFVSFLGRRKQGLAAVLVLIVITFTLVFSIVYKPKAYKYRNLHRQYTPFCVTFWRPNEIRNVVAWLKGSEFRESTVLITSMDGQGAYFASYFPEVSRRFKVFAPDVADSEIQRFLRDRKPSLLITFDGDSDVRLRMENLLGRKIGDDLIVHRERFIEVYDITPSDG